MPDLLSQDDIDNLLNGVESDVSEEIDEGILKGLTEFAEEDANDIIPTDFPVMVTSQPKKKVASVDSWFLPHIVDDYPNKEELVPKTQTIVILHGIKYLHTRGSNYYHLIK